MPSSRRRASVEALGLAADASARAHGRSAPVRNGSSNATKDWPVAPAALLFRGGKAAKCA